MVGTQPRDGYRRLAGVVAVDRSSRPRLQRGDRGSAQLWLGRRPGGRRRRTALEAVLRPTPGSEHVVEIEQRAIPADAPAVTGGAHRYRRGRAPRGPGGPRGSTRRPSTGAA